MSSYYILNKLLFFFHFDVFLPVSPILCEAAGTLFLQNDDITGSKSYVNHQAVIKEIFFSSSYLPSGLGVGKEPL